MEAGLSSFRPEFFVRRPSLMALSAKQRQFCRLVCLGLNQTEAYRRSYSATRMKPATVRREAHRLMKNPNIATTVSALNRAADQQTVNLRIADRSEVLETLTRMMRGEVEADSNRVRATQLLAQAHGLLKDRAEVVVTERSSDEIKTELLRRLSSMGHPP